MEQTTHSRKVNKHLTEQCSIQSRRKCTCQVSHEICQEEDDLKVLFDFEIICGMFL